MNRPSPHTCASTMKSLHSAADGRKVQEHLLGNYWAMVGEGINGPAAEEPRSVGEPGLFRMDETTRRLKDRTNIIGLCVIASSAVEPGSTACSS